MAGLVPAIHAVSGKFSGPGISAKFGKSMNSKIFSAGRPNCAGVLAESERGCQQQAPQRCVDKRPGPVIPPIRGAGALLLS